MCVPGFWLSLNFISLFAVRVGWLPAAGYASIQVDPAAAARFMVLPALSLGFNQSALIARISRSFMVEVLAQDYIRAARAKGCRQPAVVWVHAFRNAQGLGRLIVSAILRRDYPVVQGVVLVTAAAYVVLNLVVDVVSAFIDARIHYD